MSKERTSPSQELFNKLLKSFEQVMLVEKAYLDPDLSLYQLAKKLKTNTSYLSKIIRQYTGTGFVAYLNFLRIKEVKRIINSRRNSQFTIDTLAKECGYNHKSTFYKAFRNVTGQSPGEYRLKCNEQT